VTLTGKKIAPKAFLAFGPNQPGALLALARDLRHGARG
jgi:hypothetical protein